MKLSPSRIFDHQRMDGGFFRRIHQIDYLRALAVMGVIANHVFGLPGGFVGVDVFFVVSGFVISFLILKDSSQYNFDFATFYRHRIARIIPPLIVVSLFIYVGAKFFFLLPEDYDFVRDFWPFQAGFVHNFMFAKRSIDYFQGLTAAKINLHLWSLAVEEQFYLLYPLILILIIRFRKTWWMWAAVCISTIMSLVLLTDVYERHVVPIVFLSNAREAFSVSGMRYYFLLTRIWEFAFGAISCAISWWVWNLLGCRRFEHTLWLKVITSLCLLALVFSMIAIDGSMNWPDSRALVPVGATAIMLFMFAVFGKDAMPWQSNGALLGGIGRSSY